MTIFRVHEPSLVSRVEHVRRGTHPVRERHFRFSIFDFRWGSHRRKTQNPKSKIQNRTGFTLVEMIVATALVMLIMLLFAEIFGAAVGTITAQKGLANNDQKARSVTDILRGDLGNMTFRASVNRGANAFINAGGVRVRQSRQGIIPLGPADAADARQRGFFYFSENDPFDDTDDVLHFTVFVQETHRNAVVSDPNLTPYYGRAFTLGGNPNQPDADDGQINGASVSRAAEVCYFVRGRNLYRRVLLIREPRASAAPPFGTQPALGSTGAGAPFPVFTSAYPGSLYNDFDFSGTRVWTIDDGNGVPDDEGTDAYRFHFHGLESLDNRQGLANIPLGHPGNRFGFDFRNGRPREYLLNNSGGFVAYLGRFTHEETSHANFSWPGLEAPCGNHPLRRTDLTPDAFGAVSQYAGRPRVGEDILLTNVEAFNVEFWDPDYFEPTVAAGWTAFDPATDFNTNGVREDNGAWVNLGNSYGAGAFTQTSGVNATWGNQNPGYGPLPLAVRPNRVFDTWHPDVTYDFDGDGNLTYPYSGGWPTYRSDTVPPFSPLQIDPNPPPSGTAVAWAPFNAFGTGTVTFPNSTTYGYIVIGGAGAGTSGSRQPEWPREPGAIIRDGSAADHVLWQCFDNRIGLERIRVTVRYRDVGSGQSRQVTLIHSFVK